MKTTWSLIATMVGIFALPLCAGDQKGAVATLGLLNTRFLAASVARAEAQNPVRSDGTQLVRTERNQLPERRVSARCNCFEWKTVRDSRGNEASECARAVWESGKVYQDVQVRRYHRIVDPELYAKSKARSVGAGVGIGAGLGLGAAAALVTGLGLRFLLKTNVRVAGAAAAISGVVTAIGAGMYFGAKAKGPAYEEALRRAQANPDLAPEVNTESTVIGTFDPNPPVFGTDCSVLR